MIIDFKLDEVSTLLENILLMKRLLRTGWIRAGVPKCDIESLADHSWAVAALTYLFILEENSLRENTHEKTPVNIEKSILLALFHDFLESEYLDIDKSVFNLASTDIVKSFIHEIEKGALERISSQLPPTGRESIEKLLNEKDSVEYQLVRIADHIDLLLQTRDYLQRHWIDPENAESFQTYALKQLESYTEDFLFLKPYLTRSGFITNSEV
jgi:5'-deoxynucleotidase YfbR-like HD superfamily hydrolase